MSSVKGEARTLGYTPGQRPVRGLPAPDGDYNVTLKSKGKEGDAGWRSKPGKFPSRGVTWALQGTEDEVTGDEKTVTTFVSLSNKVLKQLAELAYASGYPHPFELARYGKPGDPGVQDMKTVADAILSYIEENGIVMKARVATEEYLGEDKNVIKRWLGPDEAEA